LTSELPCRPSKQEHSFYLKRQLVFPVSGQEAEDEEDPLTVTVKTDSEIEVANMKDRFGKMVVPPSIWGHWASGPGDSKENNKWLNEGLQEVGF
jgi:hypothetical protein